MQHTINQLDVIYAWLSDVIHDNRSDGKLVYELTEATSIIKQARKRLETVVKQSTN